MAIPKIGDQIQLVNGRTIEVQEKFKTIGVKQNENHRS
jgi:hypothetical protein